MYRNRVAIFPKEDERGRMHRKTKIDIKLIKMHERKYLQV